MAIDAMNDKRLGILGLVVQFVIAVLLAFIGFTLQGLRSDTATSLAVGQANQISIGRIDSKLDAVNARLDRLERTQDRPAGP